MTNTLEWLNSRGAERERSVKEAVSLLTEEYRNKYPSLLPMELHRLSATLSARVVYIQGLEGGARLLPVPGGFEVLVDSGLNYLRARTSIAHELVHTLFYAREDHVPRRLAKATKAEEHFCFDVGRRILAPSWMVEIAGIRDLKNGKDIFTSLLRIFKLSRSVAARIMLQDYSLTSGVAAVWSCSDGTWKMKPGSCSASAHLKRGQRTELHDHARRWLQNPDSQQPNVLGMMDKTRSAAFVLVTER